MDVITQLLQRIALQVLRFFIDNNDRIDIVVAVIAIMGIVTIDIFLFRSWIRNKDFRLARAIYLLVILVGVELGAWWLFWRFPQVLSRVLWAPSWLTAIVIRWIELYLALPLIVFLITRKKGGRRGFYSTLGHLTLFLAGWLSGEWFGFAVISLPLLFLYYYLLSRIALVIVPAANPDDWREWFQRFLLLFWYTWGFQFPVWVVKDHSGREVDTRISGDQFRTVGAPGLIWARSYHAIGITTGIETREVRGPGAVFTKPYERPFGIADLRTQLRTNEIKIITKDGIPIKAVLFTAFAIDKEIWPLGEYHRLSREEPLPEGVNTLENTEGSYPFSPARVRAALSMTGVKSSRDEPEPTDVRWDEIVLYRISEAARQVLAERRLDELWRPQHYDDHGKSALVEIAAQIRAKIADQLRIHGIRLFTARIVNYDLAGREEAQKIVQQYITSWSAFWQQQAARTLAEGEAEGERLQEVARAFAHETLLTAVAEGLQKARSIRPDLPRYVIAARFVAAIEEILRRQPELASGLSEEARARLSEAKQLLLFSS